MPTAHVTLKTIESVEITEYYWISLNQLAFPPVEILVRGLFLFDETKGLSPGRLVPQLGIQPLHCLCVLIFEKYNIPCIWDPWWWLHVIKLRSNLWSEYIKMLLIGRFKSWCKNHIYPTYGLMESRYTPRFEQIDHSSWLLPDATRTLHLNLALSLWSL